MEWQFLQFLGILLEATSAIQSWGSASSLNLVTSTSSEARWMIIEKFAGQRVFVPHFMHTDSWNALNLGDLKFKKYVKNMMKLGKYSKEIIKFNLYFPQFEPG